MLLFTKQISYRKIPLRREWLPTLVFLPGESHGQRSLVGYSPWGYITEKLTLAFPHKSILQLENKQIKVNTLTATKV